MYELYTQSRSRRKKILFPDKKDGWSQNIYLTCVKAKKQKKNLKNLLFSKPFFTSLQLRERVLILISAFANRATLASSFLENPLKKTSYTVLVEVSRRPV